MKEREISISEISRILKSTYIGEDVNINGLNLCNRETEYNSVLSFITGERFLPFVRNNKSIKGLLLTYDLYTSLEQKDALSSQISYFVVDFPEVRFYQLHEFLYNETEFYPRFSFNSEFGTNSVIHKSAVIEDGVIIGNNVKIGANSVIKKGTIIGDNSVIGSCSVVGGEGFQLIYDQDKVPFTVTHVGGTFIGKNVLVNDNCSICNSLFEGNVIIEDNCKIDSQVHIGHNCRIGKNTVITGNSLLMGSAELKSNVWIAPSTTISNRCVVNNDSFVGSMSLVTNNLPEKSNVCGIPAIPIDDYIKMIVQQKRSIKNGRKNS